MRGIVLGMALALAATAMTFVASAQEKKVRPATEKELTLLRTSLEDHLLDPDSAKLKNVAVALEADDTGMHMACGFVNSKNRMGGYAGFTAFVGVLFKETDGKPGALVLKVDEDPEDGAAARMCLERVFGEKA